MADITQIAVNNTLYNIEDANAVHTPLKTINSKTITGSGNIALNARSRKIWYGTCSTGASTASKTVSTATGDFTLDNGNMLYVRFSYAAISALISPSTPTLKVDGLSACPVVAINTSSTNDYYFWNTGETVAFVYYSSKFIVVNGAHANSSYYGKVVTLQEDISYLLNNPSVKDYYDAPSSTTLYSFNDRITTYTYPTPTYTVITLDWADESITGYATDLPPKLFIQGKVVTLVGVAKPKTTITGSTTSYKICTIPSGYWPPRTIYRIMQGSDRNKWQLMVGSAGTVSFSRYRTVGSWVNAGTSAWLPFQITWLVD